MREREYYGERKGFIKRSPEVDFQTMKKVFRLVYNNLNHAGYFQKYFGINCTDGDLPGLLGQDIETAIYLKVGKHSLWPICNNLESYNHIDLFTIIELLHDHCSVPTDSSYHSWNDCGIHVKTADDEKGKLKFRVELNPLLKRFMHVELSTQGEILEIVEDGFEPLFNAPIPTEDESIKTRMDAAMIKFRRASSTVDDRRDALRDLAEVLEYLRKQIKDVLMSNEENEIFMIANNFGIRHHNLKQRTDYDKGIWHAWIFYCYLATIHTCLRLLNKQNKQEAVIKEGGKKNLLQALRDNMQQVSKVN